MTWFECRDKLDSELASLQKEGVFPHLSGMELVALQAETRKTLNAAVHKYATTGNWPALSHNEQTMLYQRLVFGCGLARLMAGPRGQSQEWPILDSTRSGPVVIEWLLRDAWEYYELPKHMKAGQDFSEN
jgi:hypothetical protein